MCLGTINEVGEQVMSEMNEAVRIVSDFLTASMAPDPVKAATFMSNDVRITFTGGRHMPTPQDLSLIHI